MFLRLKITGMEIFTEIYYFRVNVIRVTNVVRDTKCCTSQSFIQFLWGTDYVHYQNMCLLE